jgi:hypothetical protein
MHIYIRFCLWRLSKLLDQLHHRKFRLGHNEQQLRRLYDKLFRLSHFLRRLGVIDQCWNIRDYRNDPVSLFYKWINNGGEWVDFWDGRRWRRRWL